VRPLAGREFVRLIEARGWVLLRINGSHHIYGKTGEPARLSIPIHGNQSLKSGLQRHLARIAGLTDADMS
jgi:predicted RNA binding protein YcfA (HicA-like mRNA interferase family)